MLSLIFPPKCTLCRTLLQKNETDLCHHCRANAPEIPRTKRSIPFIAKWTAVWYYKDEVRKSIHRYKFGNARSYAGVYARQLARKILETELSEGVDLLTWVPVSPLRRLSRGYDQAELLTVALGKELEMPVLRTVRKKRHTPPQSRLKDISARKANIHGAFQVSDPGLIAGKRILLLDDILTTGATSSECARVLLTAGAKEVRFAAIAAASHDNSNKHR